MVDPYVLVCGAGHWWTVVCDPVSAKGHQYVTGEIVRISPTLVVGGELNQLKEFIKNSFSN